MNEYTHHGYHLVVDEDEDKRIRPSWADQLQNKSAMQKKATIEQIFETQLQNCMEHQPHHGILSSA